MPSTPDLRRSIFHRLSLQFSNQIEKKKKNTSNPESRSAEDSQTYQRSRASPLLFSPSES
ncbi:hypothetical protein HanPI659440_Chr16g0631001 [Helianthus annuus]|nr:hypothetical protein HanPI659440_Chr16g0631001 [Helianthus annuus]